MNSIYQLTVGDFLLFPIYLFVVYLIFKKISHKYDADPKLLLYFKLGFWVKIVMVFCYTMLVQFSMGGDSINLYFTQGKHFTNIIQQDFSNISILFTNGNSYIDGLAEDCCKGYMAMEPNFMVVKVCIVLCFFTFSKYLLINLLIGFIAFLGSWQLFLFLHSQFPKLHKEFAIACLFIPTAVFWSSSISKDTICVSSLGFLTKAIYDVVKYKKNVVRNSIIGCIGIFLIYQIKPYIIISYFPLFSLYLIITKINETTNALSRFLLKISIPTIFIIIGIFIVLNSQELLEQFSSEVVLDKVVGLQNSFTAQVDDAGSTFSLGEFDGSIGSLIRMGPLAIFTTLFRPFIWESRNLIMLLSSLEVTILLLGTLSIFFKPRGFVTFFSTYFKNILVFYCISFSLLFALFVGMSTFNFGSLVRYKIPCLPFFVCGLLIIRYKVMEQSKLVHSSENKQ